MNYETACKKFLELDAECDMIEAEAKKKKAEIKKIMLDLENWITLKAQDDGLENVKTPYGTAYWSTHYTASVANPSAFKDFVVQTGAFDLMETRASKLAVKSYIEGHGEAPPGVNFSAIKVFNLRKPTEKE